MGKEPQGTKEAEGGEGKGLRRSLQCIRAYDVSFVS